MNYTRDQKSKFHLGRMLNAVVYIQKDKNKNVLKKVNFSGLDKSDILRLPNSLIEKAQQYNKVAKIIFSDANFSEHLNYNNWKMKPEESVFFLLSRYSYDLFKLKKMIESNKSIIAENSDFLFIYDATLCNPNGDPDQENKPRMDYDTDINMVTDTRIKRYIRDYLKATGKEIFVDMEGDTKVSPDFKLKAVVNRLLADNVEVDGLFGNNEVLKKEFYEIIKQKRILKISSNYFRIKRTSN